MTIRIGPGQPGMLMSPAGSSGMGGPPTPPTGPSSPGRAPTAGAAVSASQIFTCRLASPEALTATGTARRLVVVADGSPGQPPQIVAPRADVSQKLSLALISAATDQTTYWPDETVHLSLFLPGRPDTEVEVELTQRDGTPRKLGKHKSDANGVVHIVVMDGGKKPIPLGEYRIDVKTVDKKLSASVSFSVVEGTLGALSFEAPWQEFTGMGKELPLGHWHMSGRGAAGERWGHGLAVHNRILVEGKPYNGKATVISRCYLPGCNGVEVSEEQVTIKDGILRTTLNTSGHSGPFEIDITTSQGSLRHLFGQSSHVEREMVQVTSGVGRAYYVGVSPYEGTQPMSGRPFFWEERSAEASPKDPLHLAHIVAPKGEAVFVAQERVERVTAFVYTLVPGEGRFVVQRVLDIPAVLEKDQGLKVPVVFEGGGPYSLVVIAGFKTGAEKDKALFEGHSLVFTPGRLGIEVKVPAEAAPLEEVSIDLRAFDPENDTRLAAVTGVLTVYDSRTDHPDPARNLVAGLGRAVRDTGHHLVGLQDTTGMRDLDDGVTHLRRLESLTAGGPRAGAARPSSVLFVGAVTLGAPAGAPSRRASVRRVAGAGGRGGGDADTRQEGEEAEGGPIRQGMRKVVFSERVTTGPDGFARVPARLGPQGGNYRVEFAALRGHDFTTQRAQVSAHKPASAETSVPAVIVPGAVLQLPVFVNNATGSPVTFRASGGGLAAPFERRVEGERQEIALELTGRSEQVEPLLLEVRDAAGKVIDRRELPVRNVGHQQAIRSQLAIADGKTAVSIGPGERAAVYTSTGHMLRGILNNIVTAMASWFPHAEAVSANAAANALLLRAIERGILDSEGEAEHLANQVDITVRDLEERFFDGARGLFVPYPGMKEVNKLWSAWVARNLQAVVAALVDTDLGRGRLSETVERARTLATRVQQTLAAPGDTVGLVPELAGYDPAQGSQDVIVIQSAGGFQYRLLTDDAVIGWARKEFYPQLDQAQGDVLEALYKVSGIERLLRAYSRIGDIPYLIQLAKAVWQGGLTNEADRQRFYQLFSSIARGMVRTQEPGVIQGPALTGGIYGNPQALVRFLELLLMMGESERSGERKRPAQIVRITRGAGTPLGEERLPLEGTSPLIIEAVDQGDRTLLAPEFAGVLVEGTETIRMQDLMERDPFFSVAVSKPSIAVGGESIVTISLNEGEDPLEYQAIFVAPSTTGIRQTEDILLDWRGGAIHGQRATGGTTIQTATVPFRGSRTIQLALEGTTPGRSPGIVLVRHLHDPKKVTAVAIGEVAVSATEPTEPSTPRTGWRRFLPGGRKP